MFRAVIPILKKSSLAAGQELLRSGANLVGDVWKTGDLKDAQKKRGKEFISNVSNRVSDHMFGSGYSHLMGVRRAQLKSSSRGKMSRKTVKRKPVKRKTQKRKNVKSRAKTVKKKKKQNTGRSKQNIQDIFT